MEAKPQELLEFETPEGDCPIEEWLLGLKDPQTRALVRKRLNRLRLGNFGDCASVGSGVQELKIDYGPGYRVYFGRLSTTVVLLGGGDKKSQANDIATAKVRWKEYRGESR